MSNKPAPQHPRPHSPNVAQHMNGPLLNEMQSEISTEAAPLLQFLTTHALKIMLILAVFVLAVAGLGAYNWYKDKAMADAQIEFSGITSAQKGEAQIAALEEFLKKAPQGLHVAIVLAQAEAAVLEKSHVKAAEFYAKVANMEPDGAVALLAGLNQGQALIAAGKSQEAIPVLEALVPKAPQGHSFIILQALAEAALQSGDLAKAKTAFETMASEGVGGESEILRFRARGLEQQMIEDKAGEKAADNKATEEKAADNKVADETATDSKAGEASADSKASEEKAAEEKLTESKKAEEKAAEATSTENQ